MTDAIRITAISLAESDPWRNGDRLLATFDCEARGIRFRDCTLVRASRGFLIAQPPRGLRRDEGPRLAEIVDPDLRKQVAAAAHRAFVALGGVE